METMINAIASGTPAQRQRVDGSSPASERREPRVARADTDQAARQPEAREVEKAADRLNEAIRGFSRDLAISVHDDTGLLVVEVSDPSTGDVIRQIPPERLLEVEESIDKIVGLFVDNVA